MGGVARDVGSEIRLGLDRTLLRLLYVGTGSCNSVLTLVMMEARSSPRPWTFPTAVTNHVREPSAEQIILQPLRHRARITQSVQHWAFNLRLQEIESIFGREYFMSISSEKLPLIFFFFIFSGC